MNKVAATVVLLLVAASAAQANSPVNERAEYWRQRLASELPAGTPQGAILQWASKNHLTTSQKAETHQLVVSLESVAEPKSGFSASPAVCNGWGISATLQLDAMGNLASTKVQTLGNCL